MAMFEEDDSKPDLDKLEGDIEAEVSGGWSAGFPAFKALFRLER